MKNLKFKSVFFLVTYAMILYFFMLNITWFWSILGNFMAVVSPFICGFVVAYLVNRPFLFFKEKVFTKLTNNKSERHKKIGNILSLITAYIISLGIVIFLITIIVPQIILSVNQLINNFSQYVDSLTTFVHNTMAALKISESYITYVKNMLINFISNFDDFVKTIFPHVFNATKSFTAGVYNWIIGIVVSIYFLFNKDKLILQVKKLVYVIVPDKFIDKVMKFAKVTNEKFGKYVVGQLLDALIIGVCCFIGMSILKIPFATLISVIVGFTNIIPFFGPFIGAIPSVFILLMVDPVKALWFAIFVFALQQTDGNLIGPKVIGGSIGISGLWIMFSVIIGGGLFGVTGMVLGVPTFAVAYQLCGEFVNKKLKNKELIQKQDDMNK